MCIRDRLKLEIEVIEEWVEQREEMNDGLDAFIALTQKYVDEMCIRDSNSSWDRLSSVRYFFICAFSSINFPPL